MDGVLVILAGWGLALSARGLGELLLRPFRVEEPLRLPRMLWATGLGLGFLSLSTLGLGMLGLLRAPLALAALGLLLALPALRDDLLAMRAGTRTFRWPTWEGVLIAAALLAFVGTLLFAQLPQCDYDVLEYHLGAPQQYLRLGHVEHLSWNVYASFPENSEMLFLCLLSLFRSALLGGMAAAALNVAMGVFSALAVADLARSLFDAKAAVPAGVLFYAYPITWYLSGICYVEMEQVFFSILCVRALVGSGGRRMALAGAFAGLAMGTKYPSALFLAVPVGIFLLAARGFRPAVAFGLAAMIVVSPWLAKNAIATGNPVYPLLGSVFHAKGWTTEKEARFSQAHHPAMPTEGEAWRDFYASVSGVRLNEEGEATINPPKVAIVVLVAPFLLLLRGTKGRWRAAGGLLLLVLWHAATWWLWTHRIDRFFYPAVPWLAALGGAGLVGLESEFLGSAVKFLSAVAVWFHAVFGVPYALWTDRIRDESVPQIVETQSSERVVSFILRGGPPRVFLRALGGEAFDAIGYLNEELPTDARMLLVGEARTFYLERPFVGATVFDDCPLEGIFRSVPTNVAQAREALAKAGITHVLVNWSEVNRLQWTYQFTVGREVLPGYSRAATLDLFRALENGALEKVRGFGDADASLGREPVVLYRVMP